MTYLSQLCSFFLIILRPRAHFFWYSSDISTLTQTRSYFCSVTDWLNLLAEWKSAFLWLQWDAIIIPHWSHKNENIWPDRHRLRWRKRTAERWQRYKFCFCLFVASYTHMFILQPQRTNQKILKLKQSQPLINLLLLSLNPTSVKLMQHSSLPLPLISRFHTRHAYSRPSLIEVIQPSRCQTRGVL